MSTTDRSYKERKRQNQQSYRERKQEALKEQEASLKKLEAEKKELIKENSHLRSTGEVLQKISQVQDKASKQLEAIADTEKEENKGSEISSIGQANPNTELAAENLQHVFYGRDLAQGASGPSPEQLGAIIKRLDEMTPETFLESWRMFAKSLKNALHEKGTVPDEDLCRNLGELFRQRGMVSITSLRCRPRLWSSLISSFMQDPDSTSRAETVAQSLDIPAEQKEALGAAWSVYMSQVSDAEQLGEMYLAGLDQIVSNSFEGGMRNMMQEYLQLFSLGGQMELQSNQKLAALVQLLGRAGQILNVEQKAQICALSYPHFPDLVLIIYFAGREIS
eukprot:jgi/Picsp_1/2756/NSC_00984-R1_---NA---